MRLSLLKKDELKGCAAADRLNSGAAVGKSRAFSLAVLCHGGFLFQRGEDFEVLHLFVDAVFRVGNVDSFQLEQPSWVPFLVQDFCSFFQVLSRYV
ncbi:hypothetical protein E2C01_040334 [Portunus trituberculatus]|uniref:Uncharacterized protein n=1 Tax=Portunus trituberculatus TaxID=210409 RepID=A0A5B7FH95_PORTR|nr:hypothetical protein [Portunus trituberculatus]